MSFDTEPKPDKKAEAPESIQAAATKYKDEIYSGILHGDTAEAFWEAHPELLGKSEQEIGLTHGYITSTGRFIDRREALEVAWNSHQVGPDLVGRASSLLSDDLNLAETERIASAAIKYRGEIFKGRAHYNAWLEATAKYPEMVNSNEGREDGFLTSTGRFVNREEALNIAEAAGELKVTGESVIENELHAHDLKKNEE